MYINYAILTTVLEMDCVKYSSLNRCQTCLGDPTEVTSLESLNKSSDMLSILTYCDIKICTGLSNSICVKCVRTFEDIITFKHQCISSQAYLQNLYKDYLISSENEKLEDEVLCDRIKTDSTGVKIENLELNQTIKEEVVKDDDFDRSDLPSPFSETNRNEIESNKELSKSKTPGKVSCQKCPFKCDVSAELENHYQSKHNTVCPVCNKKYSNIRNLRRHKRISHQKIRPKKKSSGNMCCPKCSFKCGTNEELETHSQNKHDTVCNICNKKFFMNRNLRRHRSIHKNDRPKFFCEMCKKFYTTKHIYNQHVKKFHSNTNRERIICTLCGISVYEITKHMRTKHGNDPGDKFTCTYCNRVFKSNSSLRQHKSVFHEKSESYKSLCPECGKVCRTPGDLITHLKHVHFNERNYQCGHCEKTFKTCSAKGRHERTVHLKDRRHHCDMCLKAFSSRHKLEIHVRTHTGEKPFVCDLCSRAFGRTDTLRTHIKLVHGLENIKTISSVENVN